MEPETSNIGYLDPLRELSFLCLAVVPHQRLPPGCQPKGLALLWSPCLRHHPRHLLRGPPWFVLGRLGNVAVLAGYTIYIVYIYIYVYTHIYICTHIHTCTWTIHTYHYVWNPNLGRPYRVQNPLTEAQDSCTSTQRLLQKAPSWNKMAGPRNWVGVKELNLSYHNLDI